MSRFLLLLLSIFVSNHLAAKTLTISDNDSSISLIEHFDFFYESDSSVTLENLEAIKFESEMPPGGIYSNPIWTKITINNLTNFRKFTLEYRWVIGELILYDKTDGKFSSQKKGLFHHDKYQDNHSSIFKIDIPPYSEKTLYFKFFYEDPINFNMTITENSLFNKVQKESSALYYLFFGAIMGLLIVNLALFIYFKDITYLYYLLAILFTDVFGIGLIFGFVTEHLIPCPIFVNYNLGNVFGLLQVIFNCLFCRNFLSTHKISKICDLPLLALSFFSTLLLFPVVLIPQNVTTSMLVNYSLESMNFVILSCSIIAAFRKQSNAYFMIIGWAALMIGTNILTKCIQGDIPDTSFSRNFVFFAALFEGITMCLGLAFRMRKYNLDLKIKNAEEVALIRTIENFAHDLRSPFNAVKAVFKYMNFMLSKEQIINLNLDSCLSDIEKQLKNINSKINNILYLKGSKELISPTSLSNAVIEVVNSQTFLSNNLPIKINLSLKHSRMLIAHSVGINLVLENLISNAINAILKSNSLNNDNLVWIKSFDTNTDYTTFEIGNTNSVIKKNDVIKVFDRGFTTNKNGFGLGLDIVKSIILSWGGTISISSSKETGTKFIVTVPCCDESDNSFNTVGHNFHLRSKKKNELFQNPIIEGSKC